MNNFCRILALTTMAFNLNAMETTDFGQTPLAKNKSCGHDLKKAALIALDRAFIATSGVQRIFEPAPDLMAKKLFKREGIRKAIKIEQLSTDSHLLKVAHSANLNGLSVYLSDELTLATNAPALTGKSVTEFFNGKIMHAIVLPHEIIDITDENTGSLLLNGMVEREIARIQEAYTPNDAKIVTLKRTLCKVSTVGLMALAALWDPFTLAYTLPSGGISLKLIESLSENSSHEMTLDKKAAFLSGTTHNLIATILNKPGNAAFNTELMQEAQDALENYISPSQLTQESMRIFTLLKTQEVIDVSRALALDKVEANTTHSELEEEIGKKEDNQK